MREKASNCSCRNELGKESHIYFNARYYDPEVGRFLTEDPSRKGTSWYTYCNNNPLTFTDPTGRREIMSDRRENGVGESVKEKEWPSGTCLIRIQAQIGCQDQ
jgi:uncharacterized protein RhaS with RHS repeats